MTSMNGAALHRENDIVGDRYRIQTLLGQGGTGSTYQAEDLKTRRWVAIKVMSLKQLGQWELLSKFEREAEALGRIDHAGVPDYIEHFQVETEDDCRFYLVQEFAAGKSLDRWIADGWRTSENEVQQIALTLLDILVYLHQLDPPMVHRDIKPQNIIRQPDGRIYLVDFGAVQSAYRDVLQQQGTFVGTMGYMPPEQLRGRAVPASDLYGLGATLVYLLTHRNPDELPMERMRIAFRGRVRLSGTFASWLEKMLEPRLGQRFASAAAAIASLRPENRPSAGSSDRQSEANGEFLISYGDLPSNRQSEIADLQTDLAAPEAQTIRFAQVQLPMLQSPTELPQRTHLSRQELSQIEAQSAGEAMGEAIVVTLGCGAFLGLLVIHPLFTALMFFIVVIQNVIGGKALALIAVMGFLGALGLWGWLLSRIFSSQFHGAKQRHRLKLLAASQHSP